MDAIAVCNDIMLADFKTQATYTIWTKTVDL